MTSLRLCNKIIGFGLGLEILKDISIYRILEPVLSVTDLKFVWLGPTDDLDL